MEDKIHPEISRIYQRSCINMLIISVFLFGNLWLNLTDGLQVLHIQDKYAEGIPLVLILGFIRIIDAGTGVNAQVIGASNFWKFEFISGVIMRPPDPAELYFYKAVWHHRNSLQRSDLALGLQLYTVRIPAAQVWYATFNKNMLFALLLSGGAFLVAYFLSERRTAGSPLLHEALSFPPGCCRHILLQAHTRCSTAGRKCAQRLNI